MHNAIKAARKAKGLTLTELGDMAGISPSRLSRIENGDDAYISTARRIADALGLTLDEAWSKIETPETEPQRDKAEA